MSRSIDTRVVEMRFDNKSFESGVKQSLSTLERLKAALKTLTTSNKGLNALGSAAKTSKSNLDQIASSVSALEKRFSFLGETVRKVQNQIVSTVTGTLGKAVDYVKEGIVQGGIRRATNIENAHYQLQALLKDEDEVQKVMDNAMESVDGTAYGFDEAAKAAAMFKASGIETGDAMTNALKGLAGTAAMTNAEYERISMIFTAVAGQGRIMGDQLLQLSSLGLNAPATIAKFFNSIDEDTTKASESVKKAVKAITNGKEVTEGDIRELVSDGEIKFQIFAEAMYDAFGESAEKANETFNGSLSNMRAALARIGAEFVSPLIKQNSSVVLLINKVKDKINDVKKALTFSEEAGNIEAYSKRFTDSILKMADGLGKWVENLDIASGMKVFYNVVDGLINIFKALGSVLAPIGKAFADVFLSFKVDSVIAATGAFKAFTESLILSKKSSKNLHDAFEGIFSIIKLVVDAVIGLVSALLNVTPPVGLLSDGILGLVGMLGRGLTAFTEWIRQSTLVRRAFDLLKSAAKAVGSTFTSLVTVIKNLVNKAIEMKVVETVIGAVLLAFQKLGQFAAPYIDLIVDKLKRFVEIVKEWSKSFSENMGEKMKSVFEKVRNSLSNFKMEDVVNRINTFKDTVKSIIKLISGGFGTAIDKLKTFGEKIKKAFDFSKIVQNIREFKDLVKEFTDWFGETIGNFFKGFSFGGVLASAGGAGIIYAFVNISKALQAIAGGFKKLPDVFTAVTKVLGGFTDTLKAWQAEIKAEAIKKTATAILILAAALAVLSFTDTDKALEASKALSIIAGVMLAGTSLLMKVLNDGRALAGRIDYFSKGVGKALSNFGKAIKWKAIGSSFKDFGASILMIAGSLIALGIMYRKDGEALKEAEKLVAVMAAVMFAIMTVMAAMEKKLTVTGGGIMKTALGVLAIAAAVSTMVKALKNIMKLEYPSDWKRKLATLGGIMAGVGVLAVAVGGASKLAGTAKIKSGPIIAVALAIKVCVSALKDIFKIDMTDDWGKKFGTLSLIFLELAGLIIAMGYAQQAAGGAVKATGNLIALALDIGVITAALMVLSVIPGEGMLKGAISLGLCLGALAAALWGAAQVANEHAAKTVLNMAIMVGAITAALGVLSLVPIPDLAASAAALGAMLLALALDFNMIAKISGANKWKSILSMVAVIASIGTSLYFLSEQPWDQILSAGASLSATLAVLGGVFALISKSNPSKAAVVGFVACAAALIPITGCLYFLSGQTWSSILPGATALIAVTGSLSLALLAMGRSNPSKTAIAGFVFASLSLLPIAAVLKMLAGESWESILPGAVALVSVAAGLSAAMLIMSKAGMTITGVVAFVAGAVSLIPIAGVINSLSGLSWEEVAKGLIALAGGLTVIGVAGAAGTAIAPGLLALSAALIVFSAGIAAVGAALPIFVNGLTVAVQALSAFLSDLGNAIPQMVDAGKNLMLGLLQGIVSGISSVIEGVKTVATSVVDTVKGVLGIHSPSTVFEALGINVDEGFANGLLNGAGGIDGAIENVFGGLSDKIDVSSMLEKGEEGTSLFGDGLLSGEGDVNSIMNQIADATGMDLSSFTDMGEQGASNLASGLKSGDLNVKQIAQNLLNTNTLDAKAYEILGKDSTAKYGKGLKSGESNIKNLFKQVTDPGKTDVTSYKNVGKKAADNFATGVKNGAKSASTGAAESVAKTLKSAIQNSIKGTNFQDSGKEVVESITKGIKSQKDKPKEAIDSILKNLNSAINKQKDTFKTAGSQTVASYASGVKSKSSSATDAIKSVLKKMTTEIKSTNKDLKSKGQDLITNLVKGIKSKESDATKQAKDLASKIVKQLQNQAKNFQKPGKDSATQYVKALKTALESNMKSLTSTMTTRGKQLVQGLAQGINANIGVAKQAASKLAKQIDQQIKSELEIHSPSKVTEKRGEQVVEGFVKGITKHSGKVKEAVQKIIDSVKDGLKISFVGIEDGLRKTFETVKKNLTSTFVGLNEKKNELIPDDYLNDLIKSTIRSKPLPIDEMIEKLSGVKGRLSRSMLGAATADIEEATKDLEKVESNFVRQNLGYDQIITSEEEYWERLLAVKQNGIDQEKYLDMDVNEFRREMLSEYQTIIDDYHAQIEQEKQNIFGQVNMFEAVDKSLMRTRQEQADAEYKAAKKEEAAAKAREKAGKKDKEATGVKREVVKTMSDLMGENDKLLKSYEKNLKKAQKRLEGTNLWDYLIEQGVDSLPKLKELNQMSDKELKKAVKNFDAGMDTAYNIAVIKMGSVTQETKKNIDEMFEITGNSLTAFEIQKELGLTLEDAYWTKLLAIKQHGADQEKYLEMDLQTFRENVLSEANKILEDYKQTFETTKDNIMSEFGLFDEVSEKTAKTSEELINNLQAQIQAYEEYDATMLSLVERLKGTNLLTEIQNLGVSSLDQLKVINGMTDEELTQYADLYDTKLEKAGEIANHKMEEIKKETGEKLKELFNTVEDVDVDKFTEAFDGTLESLTTFLLGMGETMATQQTEIVNQVNELSTNMNEALISGMGELQETAQAESAGIGEALASGINEASGQAAEAAANVASSAAEAIQGANGDFQTAGQQVGEGYAQGLTNTQGEAKNSGTTLADATVKGIDSRANTFTIEGTKEGGNYNTGIKNQYSNAQVTGESLAKQAVDGAESEYSSFFEAGKKSGEGYVAGLEAMVEKAKEAAKKLAEAAKAAAESSKEIEESSNNDSAYNAGKNAGEGYAKGLASTTTSAQNAAKKVTQATTKTTTKELDIHSPSRVMSAIGKFAAQGFINGILQCVAQAASASEQLAEAAQNGSETYLHGLSDIIDEDMIANPMIKPEVDLSDVYSSISEINKLFNEAIKITSLDADMINMDVKALKRPKNSDQASIQRGKEDSSGDTFNFTQNNYSPKPLSRSDIYRQTRNQFNLFRTAVSS